MELAMMRTAAIVVAIGTAFLAGASETFLLEGWTFEKDGNSETVRIPHGELFGDVAIRLMLQRLSYGPKHPPAEVYLDLPRSKQLNNNSTRKGALK